MQGLIRASAHLLAMGFVMAAVLVLASYAGLPAIMAFALGIVAAGMVGMLSLRARRAPRHSAADEIAAMMAPAPAPARPAANAEQATTVDAMVPPASQQEVDPEANLPRWRRPSLLEARRSDPTRLTSTRRTPMRFTEDQVYQYDVRTVRYTVVPLLDRPDDVLGIHVSDLESGDEVQVIAAHGTFVEIHCPNGERGFVHRTTLRPRETTVPAHQVVPEPHDDALGALLSARGVTQS